MNDLNSDDQPPTDLILQYVLECRQGGNFLPYQDYRVIDEWLHMAVDVDSLLVVLSDVLPEFYQRRGNRPRSLLGARRTVLRRLRNQAMQRSDGGSSVNE